MATYDPAWLDRMYNNRALVPDHAAYFGRWAESSAAARSAEPCTLDVPYGTGPGETLDIFPAAQASAPVLVFIHGGYWRSLDKADHSFIAPQLVQDGAAVVVPNYGLCPAVSIEQSGLPAAAPRQAALLTRLANVRRNFSTLGAATAMQ